MTDQTMSRNFLLPITACFGQPVAENPTQVMIEAAYAQLGLDWRYITLEVSSGDLGAAVSGARAMGFRGFNCTIPHKVRVIDHLDGLGESARLMQAVNCVVRRGDQFVGENTDGKGFLRAVQRRRDTRGADVVMIGAGGAARAIAIELALGGIGRLSIVNRSRGRTDELIRLLDEHLPTLPTRTAFLDESYSVPAATDLLINATSVGLYPDVDARLPLDLTQLSSSTIIADVVFNPPLTRLLSDARSIGCQTIDGTEMLVEQGVIGVEYWTGLAPDASVMRAALEAVF
jgi:shikimate dehydrogenase